MSITILSLLPGVLNVNGDAENARVLAQRARWAGIGATIVHEPAGRPDIVVAGSGVDATMPAAASVLAGLSDELRGWLADGTCLLAVGTGFELLSEAVEMAGGQRLVGVGVFPGRAIPAPTRASGDLVVESRFGRLIGYENHARDFELPDGAQPLGTVLFGRGNGGGRTDGAIAGMAFGTHLHGPVLAKNPALADHLLDVASGGGYNPVNERAKLVDDIARAACNQIATRLELGADA